MPLLAVALPSLAQVDVVESEPESVSAPQNPLVEPQATDVAVVSEAANPQADLFYQVQTLQQEVLSLRGLVEEQAFELKRLKQQRMDDYLDLDRRVSALSNGASSVPSSVAVTPGADTSVATVSPANQDESVLYKQAIDQVLKSKDYKGATSTFNQYLQAYPKGRYAANSLYWQGEIALLSKDLEPARQWFTQLIEQWPDHRKVSDAKYKLATVYQQLGDTEKAKALLNEVIASGSDAARLAKPYLEKIQKS